jgi:hypothetical protein
MPDQLKSAIARIGPKRVYPIHTEHPELFAKFISEVGAVTVPQKNMTYPVRS